MQIKHLTALRGWQKVRSRNLEDMENFQGVLERVLIALKDCGPDQELQGHNLNLTARKMRRHISIGFLTILWKTASSPL